MYSSGVAAQLEILWKCCCNVGHWCCTCLPIVTATAGFALTVHILISQFSCRGTRCIPVSTVESVCMYIHSHKCVPRLLLLMSSPQFSVLENSSQRISKKFARGLSKDISTSLKGQTQPIFLECMPSSTCKRAFYIAGQSKGIAKQAGGNNSNFALKFMKSERWRRIVSERDTMICFQKFRRFQRMI